jgi:hypothetical protein
MGCKHDSDDTPQQEDAAYCFPTTRKRAQDGDRYLAVGYQCIAGRPRTPDSSMNSCLYLHAPYSRCCNFNRRGRLAGVEYARLENSREAREATEDFRPQRICKQGLAVPPDALFSHSYDRQNTKTPSGAEMRSQGRSIRSWIRSRLSDDMRVLLFVVGSICTRLRVHEQFHAHDRSTSDTTNSTTVATAAENVAIENTTRMKRPQVTKLR